MASPPIKQVVLTADYTARNKDGASRSFKKDEVVSGFYKTLAMQGVRVSSQSTFFVVENVFIIPAKYVREAPMMPPPDKDITMTDKTKSLVKSQDFKKGAFIGALVGGGYAFFNNKNIFYSALFGLVIGGAVSYYIKNK